MPIAVFMGSFSPREGGSERQFRQLGGYFAERGQPLLIFTQSLPGEARREVIDMCSVRRLGKPSMPYGLTKLVFSCEAVIAALWRRDIEGVVSTQLGAASAAAGVVARVKRKRHIVRLTGGGAGSPNGTEMATKLATPAGRLLVRFILGYGGVVLAAPANHLIEDARTRLRKPVPSLLIRNAVGPVANFPSKRKGVVWYYRQGPAKNLSAFLAIAELLPEVDFSVIGSVDLSSELQNVRSLGWIADPEALLRSSSALLSTSLAEGLPNLCLQAIAQGTPVVGIENPGLKEVEDLGGDLVRLSRTANPGDLATLLSSVLSSGGADASAVTLPSMGDTASLWIKELGLG